MFHTLDPAAGDPRRETAGRCTRFGLGQVHATAAAVAALFAGGESARSLVERHARGDFGEAPADERDENLASVRTQRGPVLSMYRTKLGARVWIGTTADRARTWVFTPDEELDEQEGFDERSEERRV